MIDIFEFIAFAAAVLGLLKLSVDLILASIMLVEKIQAKKKKQR